MIRRLLAFGLLAATPALGQSASPQSVGDVIHLGAYDLATGAFVPGPAPGPGDDDTTAELFVDNGTPGASFYSLGFSDEIHLARLVDEVELGGPVAVSRMTFGYASSALGETEFTISLHSGVGPDGMGGTSWPFVFDGMPGAIVDEEGNIVPQGYTFDLNLTDPTSDAAVEGKPIVITDGRLGISFQTPDLQTGPLWADVTEETNPFDPFIDVYDVDTTYEYAFTFEDAVPSPVLQVAGTSLRVTSGDRVPTTVSFGRDVLGSVGGEDEQRLRFEALAGERIVAQVRRAKGSGLRPVFDVYELATGVKTATGGKGGKNARAKFDAPRTGVYEMRITSSDGVTGSFVARVRNKPPRAARRPEEPAEPAADGTPRVVFPGRAVGTLRAKISPAEDTLKALAKPFLRTDAGDFDLGDALTQVGNDFEIDDYELPAFGGYQLVAGAVLNGDPVAQDIKARVKIPKRKKAERFTGATDDLDIVGHWLRSDFVTTENSARYVFDLDRSNGRSRLVVVDGQAITTKLIDEWRVKPSLTDLPGARFLELEVGQIVTESPAFTSTSKGGFEVLEYFHPDGDPDRIEFVGSTVVWRRPTVGLPPPGELSDEGLTEFDGEFGVPSGLPVFTMTCPDGAAWFEVFRAEGAGDRPSAPRDVVEARCTGGASDTLRYIDFDADAGVTYRYWVAVLDDEGRRGPISAPVDVAVPSEEL